MAGEPTNKVYMEPGGDKAVVASGGEIEMKSGGKITAAGTQALAIADASTAHALAVTYSDTEVEAALNVLGTKLNSALAALRGAGIVAT